MNIVYLCADRGIPVLGDKGASVHVREFTTALAGAGHEVTLLCARQGKGNPYPPARLIELPPDADPTEIRSEGERLGIGQEEYDQTVRREIDKLICDRRLAARALDALDMAGVRPDALYERYALFHRSGGDLASALRVPYVLEVNAPLVYEQERFRGLRLKAMAEEAEVAAFQRADHIVAVSEAVREHVLSRKVPANRVTVLPNGVDINRFHPQVDGQGIRTRLGLDGRPVIGFVGSLKPWHGLDFLLDAFMLVSRQSPEAVLLVVGEGPGSAALQSRATENGLGGKVIMTGRVPHEDIPSYLAAMDLTVAPYLPQDGFYFSPLKVVESLAVGRPV
ncbi:glycosyltransferase, partial [Acidithiobacillus ferriphilus]